MLVSFNLNFRQICFVLFCFVFYVAKYHLGKVKLELMQPASMPIQLISFRQVKYEFMQPAVSPFGST